MLLLSFSLLALTVCSMFHTWDLTAALKLFGMGLSIDLMYVLYVRTVTKAKSKIKAGLLSVGVATPALLGTINVYDKRVLIVPYMLGLFSGTVIAMLWEEARS